MSSGVSVVTERLPDSQVSLAIDVPQEMVDQAYERALNRLGQRLKIQGFRPGRAPRQLVEARLGQTAIREEMIESLVPGLVGQALRDNSIEAIDRPLVDVLEFERGRPGRFTARVSVMPEVGLPGFASLTVERPQTVVDDQMVQRRLLELREREAEVQPVEREIQVGDVVIADMKVEVAGQEVPAESRRGMEAEVKEGVLLPELLAALPGGRVGDLVEVDVVMPEDHSNSELAGKTARLKLTVEGVKEKRVPELDDALAKRLSDGQQENIEAFEAAVRADLEDQAARLDVIAYEQAVLKAVVEAAEISLPGALVDRQLDAELRDLEQRLTRQGLPLNGYLAYLNQTEEQWREQARPDAQARLKVDLVLEEVARRESIEPTPEEVGDHMASEAAKDPQLKDRVAELAASEGARDYFRQRLRRLRTLERLVQLSSGQPAAGVSGALPSTAEAHD